MKQRLLFNQRSHPLVVRRENAALRLSNWIPEYLRVNVCDVLFPHWKAKSTAVWMEASMYGRRSHGRGGDGGGELSHAKQSRMTSVSGWPPTEKAWALSHSLCVCLCVCVGGGGSAGSPRHQECEECVRTTVRDTRTPSAPIKITRDRFGGFWVRWFQCVCVCVCLCVCVCVFVCVCVCVCVREWSSGEG